MITDEIIDLINLISDIINQIFPNAAEFFNNIDNFTINVLPTFVNKFDLYMSYVYYFIPKNNLSVILALVTTAILVRLASAVINLIWP